VTATQGDGGDQVPVSELSYTDASRELDAIVQFFEQREVDVDLLVARLERATAIVDELDRRIRATRMQVEELVPRLEAATRAPGAASAEETSPGGDEDGGAESDEAEDDWDEADLDADTDDDQSMF
jgi:exonuclease VII small subunit